MQADDNDQVFSDFLIELKTKEALARDQALIKPISTYNEWAAHFELAKQQFTGLWALFEKIEKTVPNWKRETPTTYSESEYNILSSDPPIMIRNKSYSPVNIRGYCFRARLYRSILNGPADREFNIALDHIGCEEDLVEHDIIKAELYGLDYVKEKPNFRDYYTDPLLTSLDECRLKISVKTDFEDRLTRYLGIGFLYEHDLAEVGKRLFMLMNTPGVSDSELEAALPDDDYPRRPIADNNNLFVNRD